MILLAFIIFPSISSHKNKVPKEISQTHGMKHYTVRKQTHEYLVLTVSSYIIFFHT